ncbi:MAG: hypothetical protein ACOYOL_12710 [Chthoniobacterales bacterium]
MNNHLVHLLCLSKASINRLHLGFASCTAAAVLAGCASIVSKSEYPVAVTSNPVGADFVVKRANGIPVASGVTPSTITLSASDGYFKPARYTIEFRRKGVVQTVPLTAKLDGWYFGNILFGGVIIGMLIVDPATGAMWSLKDTVMATFQQTASAAHGPRQLQIVDINSLPMKYRGQLVALR